MWNYGSMLAQTVMLYSCSVVVLHFQWNTGITWAKLILTRIVQWIYPNLYVIFLVSLYFYVRNLKVTVLKLLNHTYFYTFSYFRVCLIIYRYVNLRQDNWVLLLGRNRLSWRRKKLFQIAKAQDTKQKYASIIANYIFPFYM